MKSIEELENRLKVHIEELLNGYPKLAQIQEEIVAAYFSMEKSYINRRKLLVAGNGGSAADAEHIVAELMKSFRKKRPIGEELTERLKKIDAEQGAALAEQLEGTLTAIALSAHEALATAYGNDVSGVGVFAQQIFGYGRPGDVFLAISTSGNSQNILRAAVAARACGISVVGLTGESGGELKRFSDVSVCVPEKETYKVQELHLPIYHCWCAMLEDKFFRI